MTEEETVVVFCDEEHATALAAALPRLAPFPYELCAVRNGPSMHRAVRLCRLDARPRVALNLCSGSAEDARGASPVLLAALLEARGAAVGGCPHSVLRQPLDALFMMCFYAGLPLPRFAVWRDAADAAGSDLRPPLRLRAADALAPTACRTLTDLTALPEALRGGRVLAWEADDAVVALLVGPRGAVAAVPPHADAALAAMAAAFARDVLRGRGFARLEFSRPRGEWRLADVALHCPLQHWAAGDLLAQCVRAARDAHTRPVAEVRHTHDGRGYFVCAARALVRGDVVFEDEGRSVAIVTRPFVERRWGAEERKLFTEYAWPLDADGHVYAIWESDPQRWRPINHACDPNCVFDEGHSLNVIAARPIKEGEELTMDYSTFCDYTMKPFQCRCGASSCRGLIVPDEASLRKYGTNAWHRRPPIPPKNSI